jgi:hypothetical protein
MYKSTGKLSFFLFLSDLCPRTCSQLPSVLSLQQDTEEAWLHLHVLKALLHKVLLNSDGQPRRVAGTRYYDDLEPAPGRSHNLPPVVELVVQYMYCLADMKTTEIDWGILLLDETLQLCQLESGEIQEINWLV